MSGPQDREGAPEAYASSEPFRPGTLKSDGIAMHFARAKYPTADRIIERVTAARFHGTVRAAVDTAMRDQAEVPAL